MCAVSNVGDQYRDKLILWQDKLVPQPKPIPAWPIPSYPEISRTEFEELKKLVLEMKEELTKARARDIANNEPDCEMEDKVVVLKRVAKMVGVSLEEVFPNDK